MTKRLEVIFAGAGGQGLVLAGSILGEAAVLTGNLRATCSQAFGVASRGGNARSEVVISSEEITYPFALAPHVVIALTAAAWRDLKDRFLPTTTVLIETAAAKEVTGQVVALPFAQTALELGRPRDINMLAVGAAVGALKGVIELSDVCQSMAARFGSEDPRIKSVICGHDLWVRSRARD